MKHAKPNVFVVNTPHQLLNAIEAAHSLHLTNNHLIVIRPKNESLDRIIPLIKLGEWMTVSFASALDKPNHRMQKSLHPVANRWYCRYLHFRQMYGLARLAARFHRVDKLFLGHYSAEWTPFMRHIANRIKYDALFLLDDGTDTIGINKRRCEIKTIALKSQVERRPSWTSIWKKMEELLRQEYWNWHLAEAPSVTFFTCYDLNIRKGDRLIRNNYAYLRSLTPLKQAWMPDTVIFLALCSAEDINMNVHLDFLSQIKVYFSGERIIYVAHPRDTASCVTRIREHLHCELWPRPSAIEYDLIVQGIKPKVVAAFVSSAVVTLASLMDPDVEIVCFQIPSEHWIHWREDAVAAYSYIKNKVRERVTIVDLPTENDCKSRA